MQGLVALPKHVHQACKGSIVQPCSQPGFVRESSGRLVSCQARRRKITKIIYEDDIEWVPTIKWNKKRLRKGRKKCDSKGPPPALLAMIGVGVLGATVGAPFILAGMGLAMFALMGPLFLGLGMALAFTAVALGPLIGITIATSLTIGAFAPVIAVGIAAWAAVRFLLRDDDSDNSDVELEAKKPKTAFDEITEVNRQM